MAAERLGLGGKVHELQIGDSFLNRKPETSYQTIRYDFKPASVDPDQMGVLKVENRSVNVTMPHIDGQSQTNYSGHVKEPSKKECVLIIDPETGNIIIERIN